MIRSGGAISIADATIATSFFSCGAAPTVHTVGSVTLAVPAPAAPFARPCGKRRSTSPKLPRDARASGTHLCIARLCLRLPIFAGVARCRLLPTLSPVILHPFRRRLPLLVRHVAPPARGLPRLRGRPRAPRFSAKRGDRRIDSSDTVQQLGPFGLEQCYDIFHRHSRLVSPPSTPPNGIAYRHSTPASAADHPGGRVPCQRPTRDRPNPRGPDLAAALDAQESGETDRGADPGGVAGEFDHGGAGRCTAWATGCSRCPSGGKAPRTRTNAQFEHIDETADKYLTSGQSVILVDTKKIVDRIGNTTRTAAGLGVRAALDTREYPTGVMVTTGWTQSPWIPTIFTGNGTTRLAPRRS